MEVVNNKYVSTAITIGLGLYTALLGPNLPTFVKDLFKNTLFRILILFLVVVRGNKDPKMAIMIAVAFVLTLDYVYVKDAKEDFANTLQQALQALQAPQAPTPAQQLAHQQAQERKHQIAINNCNIKKSDELRRKNVESKQKYINDSANLNNQKTSDLKKNNGVVEKEIELLNKQKNEQEKQNEIQFKKDIEALYQKIAIGKQSEEKFKGDFLNINNKKKQQDILIEDTIKKAIMDLNTMQANLEKKYVKEESEIKEKCVNEKVRTNSLNFGGSGGTSQVLLCNNNTFVTEIFGKAGQSIDQLGIGCSDGRQRMFVGGTGGNSFSKLSPNGFNKIGVKTNSIVNNIKVYPYSGPQQNPVGGSQGVDNTISCKQNEKIVGFNVRAGNMIDNIQVVCEN